MFLPHKRLLIRTATSVLRLQTNQKPFLNFGKLVFVIKNISRDKMADLNAAFGHVCEMFGIRELNAYQREAIVQFVKKKTGYGKSLIKLYRLFTIQFLKLLVIVVNLMKDQIDKLANLGILAVSLCEITEENAKGVVKGKISIVYGCPEAWLKNEHWIKVLSSQIYRLKLCAIAVDEAHVIKQW